MERDLQPLVDAERVLSSYVHFHDLSFDELRLVRPDMVVLRVCAFNEKTKGVDGHQFTFSEAAGFDLQGAGDMLRVTEIYSRDLTTADSGHRISFIFLTHHGEPDMQLTFRFSAVRHEAYVSKW